MADSSEAGKRAHARRRRGRDGAPIIHRIGVPHDSWRDVYHFLLSRSWATFFGIVIALYLALNLIFALLYALQPGSVAGVAPGSALDDFFFSVETMATIGFGVMHPATLYAHWLVTIEALLGILFVPLATGLIIAKFTLPTARVLFSRNLVIAPVDGVPTLMFRLANIRANQIVEARINLTLTRNVTTREGLRLRRMFDLPLQRNTNPQFALSWMVMHPIGPESPCDGLTQAAWRDEDIVILAVVTGLDATTSTTVHARHVYHGTDVLFGHAFEDILSWPEAGEVHIDYRRFHATRAVAAGES